MVERMEAAQERLAAMEEQNIYMEERKVAMEETLRLMEQKKNLFFMDTSNFDEKQKEYINLCCDQLLEQRRLM
jgi:hypothetical protein